MNVPFFIARRYLFSKKSQNAINLISMVAVCGVVVSTIALVCVLSVFNGFSGLAAMLFSSFDPELKITSRTGKVFDPDTDPIRTIRMLPEIAVCTEVLEDNAWIKFNDRQAIGVVKGVSDNFSELTLIDSTLLGGSFRTREDVVDYATLGAGLASTLGAGVAFRSPLEIYAPRRNETINLTNPMTSLNAEYAQVGGIFRLDQPVYDESYLLVSLALARDLFNYETEVSSIEIKLKNNANLASVKNKIKQIAGSSFNVQDRYEQQESSFKMVQIEKWMTFLILCFILVIALFNVVGSLSMLMIEKKEDVRTLRNLGADGKLISRIFLLEGWMISISGALIGITLGVLLCLVQQEFGLLKLGQTAGAFIIEAYPVSVEYFDIFMVFLAVIGIGYVAAWYPVHFFGKKWLKA